jgi:hypothetical protein
MVEVFVLGSLSREDSGLLLAHYLSSTYNLNFSNLP